MKRFFFSVIALAAAVTSCTEGGVIDAPQFYNNAIVFDTYIGKTPVTKAESEDLDHLKLSVGNGGGAHIYAFTCPASGAIGYANPDYVDYSWEYLDGNLIYANDNAPHWAYQVGGEEEEAYMPAGQGLAIAAYNLKSDSCISNYSSTGFDFTIKDKVSEQVDLLVTPLTFVSETGETTTVPLRFYHLLSRVGFKVQSTDASNAKIHILSVKLCGTFPKTGNVNFALASASATLSGNTTNLSVVRKPMIVSKPNSEMAYEYELIENEEFSIWASACQQTAQPIDQSESTDENRYMMIMPGSQEDGMIVVRYKLDDQQEIKATVPLSEVNRTNFEAGRAYEFILKIIAVH